MAEVRIERIPRLEGQSGTSVICRAAGLAGGDAGSWGLAGWSGRDKNEVKKADRIRCSRRIAQVCVVTEAWF